MENHDYKGKDSRKSHLSDQPAVRIGRYGNTRYWAVLMNEELLVVTVYKKGAMAFRRVLAQVFDRMAS